MTPFKVVKVDTEHRLPDWIPDALQSAGIAFSIIDCWTRDELARHAGDADMVWTFSGRQMLRGDNLLALERCGVILRTGSGTDNVDVARATELGIIVANTPYVTADALADHAISLVFSLARLITIQDRQVHRGVWEPMQAPLGRRFKGATWGLVGFGYSAKRVAQKLVGFEMNLVAHDPFVTSAVMADYGVTPVSLDELCATADYITLHCPYIPATHHLINTPLLRHMQPHTYLVNTARGPIIDEAALVQALREGWIMGAGLDVLEDEPPAPDNPLLALDNVILTPHLGGHSADFMAEAYAASVDVIRDVAQGRWPRSVVNPQVQPRWTTLRRT